MLDRRGEHTRRILAEPPVASHSVFAPSSCCTQTSLSPFDCPGDSLVLNYDVDHPSSGSCSACIRIMVRGEFSPKMLLSRPSYRRAKISDSTPTMKPSCPRLAHNHAQIGPTRQFCLTFLSLGFQRKPCTPCLRMRSCTKLSNSTTSVTVLAHCQSNILSSQKH